MRLKNNILCNKLPREGGYSCYSDGSDYPQAINGQAFHVQHIIIILISGQTWKMSGLGAEIRTEGMLRVPCPTKGTNLASTFTVILAQMTQLAKSFEPTKNGVNDSGQKTKSLARQFAARKHSQLRPFCSLWGLRSERAENS